MLDAMTKWVIISAVTIAGLILVYVLKQSEIVPSTTPPLTPNAVTITHSFKDGIHRYSGALRLPHSCYEPVATNIVHATNDPSTLVMSLTTKDALLDKRLCFQVPTTYPFEYITEAAEQVVLRLKVDGVETPVNLIETPWQSGKGTLINY